MEESSQTIRNISMEEEALNPSPSNMYKLYFKGLVSKETKKLFAGFGVAICDRDGKLLFQMRGPIHGSDITVFAAELAALKQGLTEAVRLGINHISICCDDDYIFELVMGKVTPTKDNTTRLMNDVQRMRQQLISSNPILDTRNQTSVAYKLAMETIVSEIKIHMPATCIICYNDDLEAEKMFSVASCGHHFCMECVKQHIEVKLLEGSLPTCLQYQCDSKLTLRSCANLLTPKLKAIWEQRLEEESVPVADRVYCPNPICSTLMSKTKLSKSIEECEGRSCCVICGKDFCINCKVPWHSNLSCNEYERLGPNPTTNDIKLQILANQNKWRQCGKCHQMIERSEGCVIIACRCGDQFCYVCGAGWKEGGCRHMKDHMLGFCCVMSSVLILLPSIIWFIINIFC